MHQNISDSFHSSFRLPAEWEKQSFVLLTLPHSGTDWCEQLDEVASYYRALISSITPYEQVVAMAEDMKLAEEITSGISNIQIIECPTNDTWSRDHGFLTCVNGKECLFLDFQFNGWGLKFPAYHDNQINKRLWDSGKLEGRYVNCLDFVLEGGSIESDGKGTILTTSQCLLSPNRNEMSKDELTERLQHYFNASHILWLNHGHLSGDDTDGHIDTLARLCPNNTIAYVECCDPSDSHYAELSLMQEELQQFKNAEGTPFRLVGLPMADAIIEDGERLPATYANFLIINGAVLCPTYGQPSNDQSALSKLQEIFPNRDIIGIDSRVLIRQHGSLHCSTMQFPENALNSVEITHK